MAQLGSASLTLGKGEKSRKRSRIHKDPKPHGSTSPYPKPAIVACGRHDISGYLFSAPCHGGQVAGGLTELKLHISHGETI
jgi:hypothetical protein